MFNKNLIKNLDINKYSTNNFFKKLNFFLLDNFLFICTLPIGKKSYKKEKKSSFNNILIAHPGHLGDLIILSSLLTLIRQKNPNIKVSLLTGSWNKVIIDKLLLIDNYYFVDHFLSNRSTISIFKKIRKFAYEAYFFIKNFDQNSCDLAIVPYSFSPSYVPLLFFAGIKNLYGFNSAGYGSLLSKSFNKLDPNIPEFFQQQHIPYILKIIDRKSQSYALKDPDPDNKIFLNIKKKINLPDSYTLFHTEAGSCLKEISIDEWSNIAEPFLKNGEYILFSGTSSTSKKNYDYVREIFNSKNKNIFSLVNKLSFLEFCILVKNSKFVISLDTSTIHLSGNFRIPTAIISVGTSDYRRWCFNTISSKVFRLKSNQKREKIKSSNKNILLSKEIYKYFKEYF